jgi:nucleoside-diphosphate-sugar epimerase
MQKKILLTGATGFLGSHILRRLIYEGNNVVILIRETSNLDRIKKLKGFSIFKIKQNLSNIEELFELNSIDTIIHVATEYGRRLPYSAVLYSNVYLPIRLIELASKKKLNLFINTDSFFSKFEGYSYLNEYIKTKKIFKEYLKSLTGLQIINLQLEHIYGENDSKDKFIPFLVESMGTNVNEIALTNGSQKRDFIYVEDVVDAYMVVLSNRNSLKQYSEFEVGTGISVSVKEFVLNIHQAINSNSNLLFGKLPTKLDEIQDSKADNLDLLKLGWIPRNKINQAIQKIISFEK